MRIIQKADGGARGTRVGRRSTCDCVGANGCALDREGSARGSRVPVPWEGAGVRSQIYLRRFSLSIDGLAIARSSRRCVCSCQAMVSTPPIDCAARLARADRAGRQGKASKVKQDRAAGVLREDCMYEGIW